MHYEISVLKRAIASLVITATMLLGAGVTTGALGQKAPKPGQKAVKTERKIEAGALKTHQRAEREAFKQTWRPRHRAPKNWKPAKWPKPHPRYDHSARKRCVKECNLAHKNAQRACTGRTGADRRACERAANQAHRSCQSGCPR